MTLRARVLAALALAGLCLGTARLQFMLCLVSLSVLVWIFAEWWRFHRWLRRELPRMQFQRLINGRTDGQTLWAGRRIQVEVRMNCRKPATINVRFRDYVPEQFEILSRPAGSGSVTQIVQTRRANPWTHTLASPAKSPRLSEWWDRGQHRLRMWFGDSEPLLARHESLLRVGSRIATIAYDARVLSAGHVQLPGVRMVLEDRNGLFKTHRFLEQPRHFIALPSYHESGEMRPTVKRHNSLPRHGIHRLQRSGMGSELLELREYVAGDPPKSIAWKVSARRDKLLTRQYESEVPVRVHLIIDGSIPTRIGGFGLRLLDQINFVAASIAQAAIAVGDPVECLLVDEVNGRRLPWFSGDRGLLELLKALADFSHRPPPQPGPVTPAAKQLALTVCHERYPELLDGRFNRVPWTWRADYRRRYQMVAVISQLFDLPLQEHIECMLKDEVLAKHLQHFLHQSGMPWMAPLLPAPDEPSKSSNERMETISRHLLRSLMHAHDNEVFVLIADLFSAAPNFHALQRAVKLALAKHHRVAVVCPTTTFTRPTQQSILPGSQSISDLLLAAERTRLRDLSAQLKRDLTRLGAAVSFSGEQAAIGMVLAEIDTARFGRRSVQGLR